MKGSILCPTQHIFFRLQSGWMFINRPPVRDLPRKHRNCFGRTADRHVIS